MAKTFALAALLLSACAVDGAISVDPDRGEDVGVDDVARVTGVVHGVGQGRVVLGNDAWVDSREITRGGFSFESVPDGTYFVRLEVAGYTSASETIVVDHGAASVVLNATPLVGGSFMYQWDRDASRGGHEQGSLIGSAKTQLRDAYGIELSDEDQVWSDEHAARLLQTMRAVPQPVSAAYAPIPMEPTTWVLSSGGFAQDGAVVRMPAKAFASGRFVAPQLHKEIVNLVTQRGRDRVAVDQILSERYGVRAWLFNDAEVVSLISMLEDMPAKMRAMPALKTMIRRSGGAPVRASVADAYLEIADTAFTMDRADAQFALVREKARFLATPELAEQVARFVMFGEGAALMSGLGLETERPINHVAIRAEGRQVSVELGLQIEGTSSATIYLFNDAGWCRMLRLNPANAAGTVIRGALTVAFPGTWRPDGISLRDSHGVATTRDISEVGWRLEVE